MQKFFHIDKGELPISAYLPEYEGRILCEDEDCRLPIKFVPRTSKKAAYFKIVSPYKHSIKCDAGSKNPKSNKKSKKTIQRGKPDRKNELPPVISLPNAFYLGSLNEFIKPNTKGSVKNQANYEYTGSGGGNKRTYLNNIELICKYLKKNYDQLFKLEFMCGRELKKITELFLFPGKFDYDYNSEVSKTYYIFAKIKKIHVHSNSHVSIILDCLKDNDIKIFLNRSYIKGEDEYNKLKQLEGKIVVTCGKVEKISNYLPQITLRSVRDLVIFEEP